MMDEYEKVDCDKLFDAMKTKCRRKCSKEKKEKVECLKICDKMGGDFVKNCKQNKKNIAEFKKKPKKEQEQILKDVEREDRAHEMRQKKRHRH